MGNLTIRNLSITPLELKEVERTIVNGNVKKPNGLAKITARIPGRKRAVKYNNASESAAALGGEDSDSSPNSRQEVLNVAITPFSETVTCTTAPPPGSGETLRLTFTEPGTPSQTYTATIPGPSPRSVVMSSPSGDKDKEFTLIYLPHHSYLAIFSSTALHKWMSQLPSHYPLSCLSIPGTHNSPTCYKALPSVRCQAVSIREQLDNGVRFLDIRVSCSPPPSDTNLNCTNCPEETTNLPLVHSAFPIALSGTKYLHDLLAEVYAFLDANPSETILISLKREGIGKGSDQDLSRYLATRYFGLTGTDEESDSARKRWYTLPSIPTLGSARGKCVLIRRFHLDPEASKDWNGGSGLGIDGSSWPDNCADGMCGSGQIRIQDYYEVGKSNDIATKLTYVQEELCRSAQQAFVAANAPGGSNAGGPLPFFINFLSGSNFFNASCWPEKIAAKLNPAVIDHLCIEHGAPEKGPGGLTVGDASTGVVVTDWVGHNGDWDLIRCIVGWNARLQLKQ
ncbi:PLC-like phosphodiesterase, TIM beta/alpha-barrel-containing domain containing protein [Naviculisporaceae sp. PSN 640]